MNKKKNNKKKGFTLIEMLVVVLIIGVLAAISMPIYRFAVERTRATQGIITLKNIAKAQVTYNSKKGNYADNMFSLPLDMKDGSGEDVEGAEFSDIYFDYKIFGDEFERARATRNTGEYELSVDYATGEVFCRPVDSQMCQKLGLAEGEEFVTWPQKEECDPTIYEYSSGVRYNRGQFYCIRTLYKDGTKSDRVCQYPYQGYMCRTYNNEGKKINQLDKVGNTWQIRTYSPNTGKQTSFDTYINGSLRSYQRYDENGVRLEDYSVYSSSYSLNSYDEGNGNYWMSQFNASGTPQYTLHFENGVQVSSQKYNSSGQVIYVDFWEASGARAVVWYYDDGRIKDSRCYSGDCDNWTAPERSSLKYGITGITLPPVTNYCEENPDEDFFCGDGE